MKYVVFMSLKFRTIRKKKFSQLFRNTDGEDLFLPRLRVGHALRPIFVL